MGIAHDPGRNPATAIIHNLTVGLLGLLGGNTFTICGRTKGSVAEASGQRGAPIHTFG